MRVVSLLPSATETLCLVGGSDFLVGRSHECDHPVGIQDRPILTGQITEFTTSAAIDEAVASALGAGRSLYTLDEARLEELCPDVVLTQDLCRVCSIDVETVRRVASRLRPAPEVVCLSPGSFEEILDDVLRVGRAVGLEDGATRAVVGLRERFFHAADRVTPYLDGPRVAFLEWTDPLYVAGHWTAQLVERAGAAHPLNPTRPMEGAGAGAGAQGAYTVAGPSRRVSPEELAASAPEAIVICPCGLDLENTRREAEALARRTWWRGLPAVAQGRVAIVDGSQMFNRPGPRVVDAYAWLVGWLNDRPELIPEDFPWAPFE